MNITFLPDNIVNNQILMKRLYKFFSKMDNRSVQRNITLMGRCIDPIISPISEQGVNDALCIVNGIKQSPNFNDDKVHVINTIYSTLIKKIKPEHIITGIVESETYKKLIDDSISTYFQYPLKGSVDYRHILGRMISFRDMNRNLYNLCGGILVKFKCLNWNSDNQLDFLAVIERIIFDFSVVQESYSKSSGHYTNFVSNNELTLESAKKLYMESITKLLSMTVGIVKRLMANPLSNKEIIEDKLDIAYEYFDRIPYNDANMSELIDLYSQLREQDKLLSKAISKCN